MKEILAVDFVDLQKAFSIIEYDILLSKVVYVVLQMNSLNLISQIENNMFQLMTMILILLM